MYKTSDTIFSFEQNGFASIADNELSLPNFRPDLIANLNNNSPKLLSDISISNN